MSQFRIHKVIGKIAREKQLKSKKKKPFWLWILLILLSLVLLAGLSVIVFLIYLIKDLPDINDFEKLNLAQSTLILDREGNELYAIHGEENRKSVSLQEIPDSLVKATLAIEDSQFFEHKGFDLTGILRAAWRNFTNPDERSGGSTITQQFVKNTFLTREKTYIRKLKELILAVQLEHNFSKEKIMEMYLNSIPYGSNAYGVESAAETFFAKPASQLNLAESVILAALPQAPTYYSPYGQHKLSEINKEGIEEDSLSQIKSEKELLEKYPDVVNRGLLGKVVYLNEENPLYIRGRADLVLLRMIEMGYISDEEKEQAWNEMQKVVFSLARTNIKSPHFVMYVKEELEKKYGKEVIEKGGLRVYTTLNPRLQAAAEAAIAGQVESNESRYGASNAALVSIEPKTGQVLAMVGSRDYWNTEKDGNVNVTLMKRLPGSSFKPFAYTAAFLRGYSPATVLFDLETDFGNGYKPKNFDGTFHGPVTARVALGNSYNIPAIKMGFLAGIENVYELAKSMGLQFDKGADWYGGSLPLGVAEVRPLDLVSAYSVFANEGKKVPITPFLRVEDAAGNILEEWAPSEGEQVLDKEINYLITDVLSDPKSRGAGWNQYLQLNNRVNAAKTGTSNKKIKEVTYPFDGWTLGYTPQLATGVWVGNNDGSVLSLNASGLMAAGPIWKNYMEEALNDIPEEKFVKPVGMKWVKVSALSGLLPTKWTPDGLVRNELFASLNLPSEYDTTLKVVEVDKISGKLPTEYTPESSIESRAVINFHSEMPNLPNWERPVQAWAQTRAKAYLERFGIQNILVTIPQDYDDVHTAKTSEQKPEIQIIAPITSGAVSPPEVGVTTKIDSAIGLQKVEFYFDDELLDEIYKSPWKGSLKIDPDLEVGSQHTILVKAYDRVYNTTTAQIQVKIAADDEAPYTEIVFPKDGETFEGGSLLFVKTYSYDTKSDIDRVIFYLDGEKMATATKAPYEASFVLPNETKSAVLKVQAFDYTANSSEDEIQIKIKEASMGTTSSLQILAPQANITLKLGQSQEVVFYVPADLISNLKEVNLIQQDLTTKQMNLLTTMSTFDANWNGKSTVTWLPDKVGQSDLFIRSKDKNDQITLSGKIRVTVEE